MTDAELLIKVKTAIFGSASGEWRDATLQVYIDEVKAFMKDAGVSENVINSEASVGCIVMGVNDLWNYASGGVKLYDYFKMRVTQLAMGGGNSGETT